MSTGRQPRVKYPRTPHLPGSPGASSDDEHTDAQVLLGCPDVVVTEKMDGECTTFLPDGMHARSVDSRPHPSQDWVRRLHGSIAHTIPDGMRVVGESLYAQHSVRYTALPSFFLVFSVWDGSRCLSWDDTTEWAALLGLRTVPVLHRGPMPAVRALEASWRARLGPVVSEGFVVRDAAAFPADQFADRVGKWVRPGHVQTTEHWATSAVVPNELAGT